MNDYSARQCMHWHTLMVGELNRFKATYTLRKKLFFNRSSALVCINCNTDLTGKYILSNRHQKYRCLKCAVSHHLIDEIPKGIPEDEY